MPKRRNLLQPEGSHRRNRAMAQSIRHDPAALILELSAASTPNIHSLIASAGSELPDAIVSIPLVQNIRQVRAAAEFDPKPTFGIGHASTRGLRNCRGTPAASM